MCHLSGLNVLTRDTLGDSGEAISDFQSIGEEVQVLFCIEGLRELMFLRTEERNEWGTRHQAIYGQGNTTLLVPHII